MFECACMIGSVLHAIDHVDVLLKNKNKLCVLYFGISCLVSLKIRREPWPGVELKKPARRRAWSTLRQ